MAVCHPFDDPTERRIRAAREPVPVTLLESIDGLEAGLVSGRLVEPVKPIGSIGAITRAVLVILVILEEVLQHQDSAAP